MHNAYILNNLYCPKLIIDLIIQYVSLNITGNIIPNLNSKPGNQTSAVFGFMVCSYNALTKQFWFKRHSSVIPSVQATTVLSPGFEPTIHFLCSGQ